MASTMKAVVIREPGGPEVLKIEHIPIPKPKTGQVLIKVKAFGLNRSEVFTRQGHSPGVTFPRVLGIECVGIVEDAPGNEFNKGDVVGTAMGGIGRDFDGGYAEYTCPPAKQVIKLDPKLDWTTLGAMIEMFQTAWGSLFKSLQLQKGQHLLVRGGTTSVGLAAAAIAKTHGVHVSATTRRADREALLKANGADSVFVDNGSIAGDVKAAYPDGVDKVLELVGTVTLKDSLQCVKDGGAVCMAGIVGNSWVLQELNPMDLIPTSVNLTTYGGGNEDVKATPYGELCKQIEAGTIKIPIGKVFHIDDVVEAHRAMDANTAGGKIVVLT